MGNLKMKEKISIMKMQLQQLKMSILLITTMVFSNAVLAIDIAQSPLFIDKSATPNIMFIMDDSGSMDWEILTVPHWPSYNYDYDYRRHWAKGGWLSAKEDPSANKTVDAGWIGSSGYCRDRNADGVCYNELYLNADGDRSDREKLIVTGSSVPSTRDYRLDFYHVYHWNYTGECDGPPSGPTIPTLPDARDYLPNFENMITFLTGSNNAHAHDYTGYSWNSSSSDANALPVAIIPKPNKQNTDPTDYGTRENWVHSGSNTANPAPGDAAAKIVCEALGDGSTWDDNGRKQLVHTGVTPWSSSGRLTVNTTVEPHTYTYTRADGGGANVWTNQTGSKWVKEANNPDLGDYHWEYIRPLGNDVIAPQIGLDINGDGDGNDTDTNYWYEKDYDVGSSIVLNNDSGRVRYNYLNRFTDNVYSNGSLSRVCLRNHYYSSTATCPTANEPGGYDGGTPAIADRRGQRASVYEVPVSIPRNIRSPSTWVGATPNVNVTLPGWATGTKHAMSLHDPWPILVDWRIRSSDFNVMYYSPKSKYEFWPDLANADFNAVRSNPQPGTTGYSITSNLANPRTETSGAVEAGFVYEVWVDDASSLDSTSNVPKYIPGDQLCGSTGGYTLTAADVAHDSSGTQGIVDPSTVVIDSISGAVTTAGTKKVAGDHVCFSYSDKPDDGVVDLWDSHYRVEVRGDGTDSHDEIVVQKVRRTPHLDGEQLYTTSVYTKADFDGSDVDSADYAAMKVALSDTRILKTVTYSGLDTAIPLDPFCRIVLGVDDENAPTRCKTVREVQQNAANWFQYSRKRSYVAKGAISTLIAQLPDLNYGLMGTSRSHIVDSSDSTATDLATDISKLFKDVYMGGGQGNSLTLRTSHNTALRTSLYNHPWRQSATPLRQALQRAGEYFAGRGPDISGTGIPTNVNNHSTSPIVESCQKNFALLLTDGYWSGAHDPAGVGNADGDAFSDTLADVAKKYYDEDLSALGNDVPTDTFDTNSQQHLTTIGIGFGVTGSLVDDPNPLAGPSEDGWPGDPDASGASTFIETTTWGGDPAPNAAANQPYKIDDLWHAAYNSRGKYYQANNPQELIDRLRSAVLTALAATGSASSLSVNSTVLTASTRVYQTLFKSGDWTGEIKSYSIAASGLINSVPEWTAQTQLQGVAPGSRRIITLDASGAGIPFTWANLSAPSQQNMLRTRFFPNVLENVAFGQAQLDYIRGQSDPQFRLRAAKLGDIVHSEPVYVGTPNQLYTDASYLTFKTAKQALNSGAGRAPMLYVGANDGMMHAFDAATGAEKYAYIPRVLLPELNALGQIPGSGQTYAHRYYVDDSPVSADVYYSGNWHTVLAGGLRAGGKGIYALDITTVPGGGATEGAIAGNKALWEFTSADDTDMGYSFSRPSIVRLNNGKFGAVFGNGYNSNNNKAVLYIVDIEDGSLIKKFDTVVGDLANSNGMSTPTVIDTDGDMIADRVYAGDLLGNVWSIDISDSSSANWEFSYSTNFPAAETPLFTATSASPGLQSITAPIVVSEHPLGPLAGYILNFGTGKYLGTSDNTNLGQEDQTMYGLWDYGVAGITRADLLSQEIIADVVHADSNTAVRVTSANGPVNWMNAGHNVGEVSWQSQVDQKGWRMDLTDTSASPLNNQGERVVSPMAIQGGAIILSTLLPAGDPCDGGGSGWVMTLNAATGARFNESPFDINGDGLFTSGDFADLDSDGTADTAVSGVKSDSGIPSTPILLSVPGGGTVALSDHSSGGLAFDGTSTAGSAACVVVGTGSCTVVPAILPGGPATCTVTDPGASCYIGGHCAGGSCLGFNFSDTGRQSWMQLE